MSEYERRVSFEPGYNYLHETGPRRRGQHGMSIRFLLIGPDGATQFLMQTFWTPLGKGDADAPGREPCHIDHWQRFGTSHFGLVNAPSGSDLGYHWRAPLYDGHDGMGCEYLDADCYYDGSGLRADDLLREFISHGEAAVWDALAGEYRYCQERQAEYAAEADQ